MFVFIDLQKKYSDKRAGVEARSRTAITTAMGLKQH